MGILSRFKNKKKAERRCGDCGVIIVDGKCLKNSEDESYVWCWECAPKTMAIIEAFRILNDEKREMNIEELRKFEAMYTLKGGIEKISEIPKMCEKKDNIPNNGTRIDSFVIKDDGPKRIVATSFQCPHCKQKLQINSDLNPDLEKRLSHIINRLPELLTPLYYSNWIISHHGTCPGCKKTFIVQK